MKTSEGVTPTRMELFQLKKRVKLAEKGHDLLKEKRDALVMEFFKIYEKRNTLRKELKNYLKNAYESLNSALLMIGYKNVTQAADATNKTAEINVARKNIMGVIIPSIKEIETKRHFTERGYALGDSSPTLDNAAKNFEIALKKIIELSEVEGTIKKLAIEIEKTKRRVNALEYIFLPKLKNSIKYIQMRLDEMERENFFRLKRIKSLIKV